LVNRPVTLDLLPTGQPVGTGEHDVRARSGLETDGLFRRPARFDQDTFPVKTAPD
jgi:hypothetical protein